MIPIDFILNLQRLINQNSGSIESMVPAIMAASSRGHTEEEVLNEFKRICKCPNLGDLLVMSFFSLDARGLWNSRWVGKEFEFLVRDAFADMSKNQSAEIARQLHRAATIIEVHGVDIRGG